MIPFALPAIGGRAAAIAALVAVLAGGFVVTRCQRDRAAEQAASATAAAVSVDETVQAAADVQRVVIDVNSTERAIDARTMENRDAIFRADGAGLDMPAAVAAAGRHALCLRPTYHSDPACEQLRDADPE